jgi:hypothetical protein
MKIFAIGSVGLSLSDICLDVCVNYGTDCGSPKLETFSSLSEAEEKLNSYNNPNHNSFIEGEYKVYEISISVKE